MLISPVIFIGLIGVLLTLFGTVVYLAYFGTREKRESPVANEVLVRAEREAEEIVKEAVEKAHETMTDAQYIKDDLIRSIESSMRSIAESAVVSFQEETQKTHSRFVDLFGEIRDQYKFETQKTVEALEKESARESQNFRDELAKEVVAAQQKADARAEAAYEAVKLELEEYKRQKMSEVDAKINEMVGKVFSEVLGKSLTGDEHAQLVTRALENAKKSGIFGLGDGSSQASQAEANEESKSNGKKLGATEYKPINNNNT